MHILVAEDDPLSRRLLQHHLQKWGHQVTLTVDGSAAWEAFQKQQFQMIISDWMMPGIDGIELIRRVRAANKPGYVYSILLTAKGRKEDLISGMEAGADEFLVKPMDTDELKVRLRVGERIVQLERRLAQRNSELSQANELMKKDLRAASKIQESLLPKKAPSADSVDIAWIFKPCDELAGDFLNIFKLDENNLAFYILDVSGHGVPAALLSVTLSRILSPDPRQSDLLVQRNGENETLKIVPPGVVATRLNQKFPIDMETGQFFTLMYGLLNIPEKSLRFVSAGHPGIAYLPHNSDAKILESPGLPIGIMDTAQYQEQSLTLHPGDRIVLYSDGVVEAANQEGEQLGKDGLARAFLKNRNRQLQESVARVIQDLGSWCGCNHFSDDVTMLALEILD